MSVFVGKDAYKKEARKEKKNYYTKKITKDYPLHCPRVCMQTKSGSKGKKTYDGKICYNCGYGR